jgi:prolipoprotein diacylglyceryltransferase
MNMMRIWEWGMSFHGGLIGTILAVLFFSWRYHYSFWSLIDTLAIIIPVALGLGRIGNWMNQELPGYTPYDGIFPMQIAWVAHFPSPLLEMLLEGIVLFIVMLSFSRFFSKNIPKRISQKQEIQGRKIFSIGASLSGGNWETNFYNDEVPRLSANEVADKIVCKARSFSEIPWFLSGIFLVGYSMARLIAEQYRLPDAHIGYLLSTHWLTLGILYTVPMMIYGVCLVSQNFGFLKNKKFEAEKFFR